MAEGFDKWGSFFKYSWVLIPLVIHGAIIIAAVLIYAFTSIQIKEDTSATAASIMDMSLGHILAGIRSIHEANHSTVVIAGSLKTMTSRSYLSYMEQNLFVAFAMQPQVAEMSYAGVDGSAFTHYREDGQPRAMFAGPHGKWYTQATDPATGHLVGHSAAVRLPNHLPDAAQVLADAKNGSPASLRSGWAYPNVEMVVFSTPVGDVGVISAAVPVDDIMAIAHRAKAGFRTADAYYAITDIKRGASTGYKPLLAGSDAKAAEALFSGINCTSSAVDAPILELHGAGHGSHREEYRVACTSFDLSGVNLGLRLVFRHEASVFRRMGLAVVCVVCSLLAVAAVVCFFMVRSLRRAGAREAALQADLVRQKEALQQAERKSMNKSNAFARANHDIRTSLASLGGLVEMALPEARANPNLTYFLDQMTVGNKKLLDILNTILDMSKVESGKMQLEEVQFSMTEVLEESMDMANVVGMSRGVEVIWDPSDFSVLRCDDIIGDSKRIKQILDNLLSNAIKFTDEGHVMIRAWANRPIARTSMISTPSRFAPRWHIGGICPWLLGARDDGAEQNARRSLQNDPNSVEFYFEVVDTGVGIPKEKRESVFENYVQVNEGQGGTGLGLGIVQSFVRLMGGEINIKEKEPGVAGTCLGFNIFLKNSEKPEAEEDIEQGRTATSLFREPGCFKGGHCVLLVHGNETRRILQTWMESLGMKVWSVPHAKLLAPTLEKARVATGASPSRPASMSSSQGGGGGDLDGATDRCFSSKEIVTHVLRSGSGNHAGHLHPFGLLVVVDISCGMLDEVVREAACLARIKHQVPSRVVCLMDLRTSSEDLRRFREEASCDLDLRKPIHGSRLCMLLQTMRDLQASPFQQQHPYQAGITVNEKLPAAESEITVVAASVPQGPSTVGDDKPLEGMRVLLVEDTMVLQTIQNKILTILGAAVEIAGDGSKAVAMFTKALEDAGGGVLEDHHADEVASKRYDMIFMDCQMPVMDGYEATRRIREEESRHGIHTPIIALTAHSEEEYLQETIHAGMDLYLTKPIQRNKIVEAVYQVCKELKN